MLRSVIYSHLLWVLCQTLARSGPTQRQPSRARKYQYTMAISMQLGFPSGIIRKHCNYTEKISMAPAQG